MTNTSTLLHLVNINGIPCTESSSVSTTTTNVVYSFNPSPIRYPNFSGLIAVKITTAAPAASDALPVQFTTTGVSGSTIALTTFAGAAVTSANLAAGIHLVFFDRAAGVLQLIA